MRIWYGGTGRDKFYCPGCDFVAKAKLTAICPLCREPMISMSDVWRPGRKGTRTRTWDARVLRHRENARRVNGRLWAPGSGYTQEWVRSRISQGKAAR